MAIEPVDHRIAHWAAACLATRAATLKLTAAGEPSPPDADPDDPILRPVYRLRGPLGLHGHDAALWASINRESGVWDIAA